ncbi:MAG TPA: arylamine N-acetyltransferase [Solirubrobacteraceae bacterium]|nr:arylamine N-acetyltransferase [Solirubrobacteraceae bacterium]
MSSLDPDVRDRLLRRIGLASAPAPDAVGLRQVHRAFVSRVPYENLAIQLGETEALDPVRLVQRVLLGGRGGYCFEVNSVLHVLLESLGFAVERRQGIVGAREAHARGEPTNHMALVVDTPDEGRFIAEAGWGEGPLDPLALVEGPVTSGVFERRIAREREGWWLTQHEFGATAGFHFADAPATLDDFAAHHLRLSTAPDSVFVAGLIVQRPFDDRILTLRSRTLALDGPGVYERRILPNREAFASVLQERFEIDVAALGSDRLERLWQNAVRQHDARHRYPNWVYTGARAWRARRRRAKGRARPTRASA